MATRKITVPEAGKSQAYELTGLSAIIISAPSYRSPEEAPRLSFDNPGDDFPILSRSVFPSDAGQFKRVIITGTEASAGDEITILTLALCLDAYINTDVAGTSKSFSGTTFNITMDDTVQQLPDLQLIDANGNLPTAVYISASGGNINYRWNSDPATGGSDHLLLDGAEPIEILGIDFIQKIRFINQTAAATPDLAITPRY